MKKILLMLVILTLLLVSPVQAKKKPTPTPQPTNTSVPTETPIPSGVTGYTVQEENHIIHVGGIDFEMTCPAGQKVMSGSMSDPTFAVGLPISHPALDGQSWVFHVTNPSSGDIGGITFYIVCIDVAP